MLFEVYRCVQLNRWYVGVYYIWDREGRCGVYRRLCVGMIFCHQTAFFHLSTHFRAFSLNFRRSSKMQGYAGNEHCNICLMVSGA